ncbi:hypothetical protein NEIMUCOT_06673 [Neisseria mucosa ATCC 25996]|uniref:Uncharacterized protein n=1 Tax=Neisseria mucosa (strain ATCC 25996 / DSM 4631 / NCTC 10774 / M26) TaxID=546266 RepID=D3A178_NEIM2|nr:hypothetical protein NEIMUCOT_06673 [Neisseria mucosa ATCC 25996]
MFGNHGLCGLLEEGAHEKSPKCLGGNLGDFWEFCKGLSQCIDSTTSTNPPQFRSGPTHILKSPFFYNRSIQSITPFRPTAAIKAGMSGSPNLSTIQSKSPRQLSGA